MLKTKIQFYTQMYNDTQKVSHLMCFVGMLLIKIYDFLIYKIDL